MDYEDLTVEQVLGPQGLLSSSFPNYEYRPQQLEMSRAVSAVFAGTEGSSRSLLVEAGTGIGKSFAYLVPAIQHASRTGGKFVISTNTIALQEQLLQKDIPVLQAVMPDEFTAVLAKGRGNYICHRRLQNAVDRSGTLLEEASHVKELKRIEAWAAATKDGSLSDLAEEPSTALWLQVNAEQGNCMGKRCKFYSRCHYQASRRRMYNANILVVNHHLLMADLALRATGASVLPDYDHLIIDEAHSLEDVASEHLGVRVTSSQVQFYLNHLFNPKKGTGFLLGRLTSTLEKRIDDARRASHAFFDGVFAWYDRQAPENKRVVGAHFVENPLTEALLALHHEMAEIAGSIDDENQELEFRSQMARCVALADSVRVFVDQSAAGFVYWVERGGRGGTALELLGSPVDVSDLLRAQLVEKIKSVVMTSATMTLGKKQSFRFIAERLGMGQAATLALGSPFNYEIQAELHIPAAMPPPEHPDYERELDGWIAHYLLRAKGGVFVLFTSHAQMTRSFQALKPFLIRNGFFAQMQGDGVPRSHMIQQFKAAQRAVLFGVETFWQGIDIPGNALETVILTRLPFPVPSHPLVEARSELIEQCGRSAFMDYSLPHAVLKLKQGFGRLIRTQTDRGRIVILDSRVLTKRYGALFVDSLPLCPIITDEAKPSTNLFA